MKRPDPSRLEWLAFAAAFSVLAAVAVAWLASPQLVAVR